MHTYAYFHRTNETKEQFFHAAEHNKQVSHAPRQREKPINLRDNRGINSDRQTFICTVGLWLNTKQIPERQRKQEELLKKLFF